MVSSHEIESGHRSQSAAVAPDAGVALGEDEWRANTYALLGALLAAPPSAQLLELLQTIDGTSGRQGDMGDAWRMLKLAARDSAPSAVDDEYHDLFIGLGQGELVPYGSWYMTGSLMDRPLVYLRRDLAQLGIERQAEVHEPEDHASALCEAMHVIVTAPDIPREWQRRFFREHVTPWMGLFFQDLQQARSACFYIAVGRLGESFMNLENRYLDMPA